MRVEVRPWGGRGERRVGSNCFLSELFPLPATLSSYSVMELFIVPDSKYHSSEHWSQERAAGTDRVLGWV